MFRNNAFHLLLLSIFCFLNHIALSQVWTTKASYPGHERDDGVSFTIGDKAYCGTGLSSWFAPLGDFYSFDFNTEQWTIEAPIPAGSERQYATGFSNQLYGYVFGGVNGNTYLNDLWRYETGGQIWQQMSPLPDTARSGSAGFFLNGQLFVIGGKTKTRDAINEVWAYDIATDSWSQKNNLPYSLWRASASATDSLGYLTFGIDENGHYRNELLAYNPNSDQWYALSPYPENGLTHSTLENMGEFLLSFGGRDSNDLYSNHLFRYNILTDSWTELSALPGSHRKGGVAFGHQNTFYYTTGITSLASRLTQTWACSDVFISNDEHTTSAIQVFPNPVASKLWLSLPRGMHNVSIEFYDTTGRLKLKRKMNETTNYIDVEKLSKGVYYLIINNSDYSLQRQILKL